MLTVFLITALLALLLAYQQWRRTKLPPGPIPLPIVGNLPQIAWLSAKHGGIVGAMKEWKKEFGPVFTIWMGPLATVHICTMELAQETMLKRGTEFTERWVPLHFNLERNGLGIIGTSGEHWMEQRRFALHTLRNFGLGKSLMEDKIMEEFNLRADAMDKKNGNKTVELNPQPFFDMTVGSIINRMLFNEALDEKSGEEFYEHKRELDKFFERLSFFDFLVQKKFMSNLPIIRERTAKMTKPQHGVKNFLKKQVEERIQAIESGDHVILDTPEDYVDAFLQKMQEEVGNPGTSYDIDSLVINLMDLWIAGQETTVTTIIGAFANLLNNLDVVKVLKMCKKFFQVIKKVREELMQVTGGGRDLSMKDKSNTPYFNATIMEIQRHASILNINLFRRAAEDTLIGGHPVEKGTPLTAEISILMSDDRYFKDSAKFDPSRFLTGEKLDQHVVPFGIGKRACLGESLARAELYLIIGNMILRYHMEPSDVLPVTEQLNNTGIMKRPSGYTMKIRKID